MRPGRLVGPVLFIVGAAALAFGVVQGEATLSLFVIFPVVTATGLWGFLGILLMVAGVFLFFLAGSGVSGFAYGAAPAATPVPPDSAAPPSETRRRWGGVVFLGPVPVVFGSDPKVTKWMLLVGVLLFVALVVFTVLVLYGI